MSAVYVIRTYQSKRTIISGNVQSALMTFKVISMLWIIPGIGLILVGDGIASIVHFKEHATSFEQSVRVLRTILGAYLMIIPIYW